jgi:hypothetical protein
MPRSRIELRNLVPAVGTAAVVVLIGLTILGCQESKTTTRQDAEPGSQAQAEAIPIKGRAQIWTENCMRCHNIRDPKSLSDTQWQVALHQMRVRGNLLAKEHEAILELMQASN